MKTVRFLGLEIRRRTGCSVCGKSRRVSTPVSSRIINLPSGARRAFVKGEAVTLSDSDADFLLNHVKNGGLPAFEVVYDH